MEGFWSLFANCIAEAGKKKLIGYESVYNGNWDVLLAVQRILASEACFANLFGKSFSRLSAGV